jgi:hypothetical protein
MQELEVAILREEGCESVIIAPYKISPSPENSFIGKQS